MLWTIFLLILIKDVLRSILQYKYVVLLKGILITVEVELKYISVKEQVKEILESFDLCQCLFYSEHSMSVQPLSEWRCVWRCQTRLLLYLSTV